MARSRSPGASQTRAVSDAAFHAAEAPLWPTHQVISIAPADGDKIAILDRLTQAEQITRELESEPEGVADLDKESWHALYEVLYCSLRIRGEYSVDDRLILATLRIVHSWAHAVSSPDVDFWAGAIGWHRLSINPAVSDAAKSCLPVLQARCAKPNQGRFLLRASSAPDSSSEELMRPSASTTGTDPNALLRAGDEPAEKRTTE
jgi:hypothetical protein